MRRCFAALAIGCLVLAPSRASAQRPLKTRTVVLIVSDGVRWQEVFTGAERDLMTRESGGVGDTTALQQRFWRETATERREALMPFFWKSIARRGQLFGDRAVGSDAHVTNGLKFSYPGYNEMLTGGPDPRIDRNTAGPNPNMTVLEWIARQRGFAGRVAAFGTWDEFGDIFNRRRSGLFIRAGWEVPAISPRTKLLDGLYETTTRLWGDLAYDSFMQQAVLDDLRTRRPRLLFVGYGETDEWAHDGRYDQVLASLHRVDAFIAGLWNTMQAMPEYRGTTTLIITTDHGRGAGLTKWRDHGKDVEGAENVWMAVLGPDTPALGEVQRHQPVTQSQIAATVAAFLGKRFDTAVPGAAPPISGVMRGP